MADRDPKEKSTTDAKGKPGPNDRTVIYPVEEGEEATPSRPQYQPPYIVIIDGPHTGARFPLSDGPPNAIGRAQECVVRLEDQSVSRHHAEMLKGPSGWTVKDLGSKNGTLVNGKLIADVVVIGHKDIIKAGIYFLRLITQPTRLEEEMMLPAEILMADRTVFVAAPPDHLTAEVKRNVPPKEEATGGGALPEPPGGEDVSMPPPPRRPGKRQFIMFGALTLVLIAAAAYYANRILFKPTRPTKPVITEPTAQPPSKIEVPPGMEPQPVPSQPGGEPLPPSSPPTETPPTVQVPPSVVAAQAIPIFLDLASSPIPAKATFEGKELGMTPIRVNVNLEPDKTYRAQALFVMPEIQQQYTQEVEFIVGKDKPIIPVFFRGPIGMLKVNDLPRDVQFYLEGKFSYDKFQEQSAKLKEIVLQKPIYVPYGNYRLELRRARQLGETSPTYVSDIAFLREFVITEDSPIYTLEVKEEDLKTFPAKITSQPPNADVFIDGQVVGKTPYEGMFPLGEHNLALRKEGYFEHTENLKVDINTPFTADVKLKTSIAGAHINNARLAMSRAMYQDAINELAEALNSQPAPSEVALINYLLGVSYLRVNDVNRAIEYFEQAKGHESQRLKAMVGLSNCYAVIGKIDVALPLIVEVLLKALDETTKKEANDLFQKISPFRSVVFVYSDPAGAKVTVNDKGVPQPTPVILHDLPLGNYKIRLEKPGYLSTDLSLSLSVNEFNPVIVKLRPIPQ